MIENHEAILSVVDVAERLRNRMGHALDCGHPLEELAELDRALAAAGRPRAPASARMIAAARTIDHMASRVEGMVRSVFQYEQTPEAQREWIRALRRGLCKSLVILSSENVKVAALIRGAVNGAIGDPAEAA